jgi:hypothetical protein
MAPGGATAWAWGPPQCGQSIPVISAASGALASAGSLRTRLLPVRLRVTVLGQGQGWILARVGSKVHLSASLEDRDFNPGLHDGVLRPRLVGNA